MTVCTVRRSGLVLEISALISTLRAPEPPTAAVSHLQRITVYRDAAVLRYLNCIENAQKHLCYEWVESQPQMLQSRLV